MPYPDECLRGIPSRLDVEDGLVKTSVFYFNDNYAKADGTLVQSVNWHDDENAIQFTRAQAKTDDGTPQFKGGIAVIPHAVLERISSLPTLEWRFSFEREALPNNPYHGNLTLAAQSSKQLRKQLAGALALAVSRIEPPAEG
jgi:hypothetical protein